MLASVISVIYFLRLIWRPQENGKGPGFMTAIVFYSVTLASCRVKSIAINAHGLVLYSTFINVKLIRSVLCQKLTFLS